LLVLTPLGWALGIVAGIVLIVLVESVGARGMQTPLVLGVALGLATQQFRALRPVLEGSRGRWLLASCLGLAAPFALADAATLAGRPHPYDLTGFVVLGGVVASLLQWGILRAAVRRSGAWLLASPLGYAAAASAVWVAERVLPKTPGLVGALQYLVVIAAGGVLLGAFTAGAASRFKRSPTVVTPPSPPPPRPPGQPGRPTSRLP
jgi:hypothetical protein